MGCPRGGTSEEYVRQQGIESRSAALHRAVRLLRAAGLGADCEAAWDEWQLGEEAAVGCHGR